MPILVLPKRKKKLIKMKHVFMFYFLIFNTLIVSLNMTYEFYMTINFNKFGVRFVKILEKAYSFQYVLKRRKVGHSLHFHIKAPIFCKFSSYNLWSDEYFPALASCIENTDSPWILFKVSIFRTFPQMVSSWIWAQALKNWVYLLFLNTIILLQRLYEEKNLHKIINYFFQ